MYIEVTYSTQIFLPSVIAGVLLLSTVVSGLLFAQLKNRIYLATFFCLVTSFGFTLSGAASNYLSDIGDVPLGLQMSRLEQLFAAAFIPVVAFLLQTFETPLYAQTRLVFLWGAMAAFAALLIVALVHPDLFVSIKTVTDEVQFEESCVARGMQGPLYIVRDIMLSGIFVYAMWILRKMRSGGVVREITGPFMAGLVVAMALGLNDMLNAYTYHKRFLPAILDFSWSSLGMGIFGVLIIFGAIKLFLAQLNQSEHKYGSTRDLMIEIVDAMDSMVIGVDEDHRVVLWNRLASERLALSKDDVLGQRIENVVPSLTDDPEVLPEALNEVIERNRSFRDERRILRPSGDYRYEDFRMLPLLSRYAKGAVLIITDMTEKKRLQEHIVQTEKMVSVGGLAAGIAHEINNPLAGIMQNAQLAQTRLLKRTLLNDKAAAEAGVSFNALERYLEARRLPDILGAIVKSGMRASQVIHNIIDFSRQDTGDVSYAVISDVIDQVLEVARNDWDLKQSYDFKNIQIVKAYDLSIPVVPCEIQNMSQVFFNIIRNAAQAIHSARPKVPTLTIRTGPGERGMVRIEIEDNGAGIPKSIQNRIFDPFFTTKDVGEGTGLGLSVCYYVVTEHHKGTISVLSPEDGGSRFVIDLPTQS
ncbi:MAG: PAS domain-containing protein [Deltaproteobacteria bacterium]|nr:PAS domain-containing protein [Deltaproteobacteria bacterium]